MKNVREKSNFFFAVKYAVLSCSCCCRRRGFLSSQININSLVFVFITQQGIIEQSSNDLQKKQYQSDYYNLSQQEKTGR